MRYKYRYNIPDRMNSENYYEFESYSDEIDPSVVAEYAALDYHSNHDGWESYWPITFVVQKMDGEVLGTYEVNREFDPMFWAKEVKK